MTLAFPDFSKPFKLSTDASNVAIGGVLSHTDDVTGEDRPITFNSRRLSNTERNYSTVDKEAFSLIYGLKYNRSFIHGREVELVSDSEPLVYLLKHKNPSSRNTRWLAILSEYRITNIKHLPGFKNIVPDMLSRLIDENIETKLVDDLPWAVNSINSGNNNIVSMVTRSKAASSQCTPANQTSPPGSQRMQTAGRERLM